MAFRGVAGKIDVLLSMANGALGRLVASRHGASALTGLQCDRFAAIRALSTTAHNDAKPSSSDDDAAYFKKLAAFPKRETGPSFKASDVQKELTKSPRWKKFMAETKKVAFGAEYTDHMLVVDWTKENGWAKPKIVPFADIPLHPASKVLHYATAIFEGMKAFRGDDGKLRIFRPMHNMHRFTTSASRACLPMFCEQQALDLLCEFIKVEQNWIPSKDNLGPGSSLYIRPTMIGTTGTLGVDTPQHATYFVILSPVQSYFSGDVPAVSLLADPRFVRSAYGGVGDSKMACNYAPALRIQEEAAAKGYQAVLWLYGNEAMVTEAGMMNVFFVMENGKGEKELVTPPLDGLILPGSTRRCTLDLARNMKGRDFQVSERRVTMKELADASQKGKLFECFGTGTAAVILPVGSIDWKDNCKIDIPTIKQKDPIHAKIFKAITDIQYGRVQHEWGYVIN